jgi:hypothetical protein
MISDELVRLERYIERFRDCKKRKDKLGRRVVGRGGGVSRLP